MEAKDTVMTEQEIMDMLGYIKFNPSFADELKRVTKAQDEISFKAGEQKGTEKVVEWMIEPCPHTASASYFRPKCICTECKQAQLKEWEL